MHKKEVIYQLDSLPAVGLSLFAWAEIQARFEVDYKAKTATATSMTVKLPEVEQAADETVKNYFSMANKWELKSNPDPANINTPDVLVPAAMTEQWTDLNCEMRDMVINHFRLHAASRSSDHAMMQM